MNRRAILVMGALLTGVPCGTAVPAGAEEGASRRDEARVYILNFSIAAQAANLVRDPCQMIDAGCRVSVVKDSVLSVLASTDAQEEVSSLLRQIDLPPRSQTFHIAILAGGPVEQPAFDLPGRMARALGESSALLPYKGYRLLEQGLLTTTHQGRIALGDPATGFEARLKMEGGADPGAPLHVRSFEMLRARWEQVGKELVRRTVIDTSFTIRPGASVVLGASRLDAGDETLVVLVTAVSGG